MSNYQVGQYILNRCTNCFHKEMKIIKVIEKNFNEKVTYVLWTKCPVCGAKDNELVPENK
ncbi:hypothetical protein [Thalassobacillus pellis]|uniref:hypothetical protein n=1 Tax=Thalassobacillus pellis TaxID=748008 RepID=UPI0019617E4C|nr:hypothetical protein [Thalassobacillus pellis]MBM7554803.1 rRNA maturation protein Nop10 [Thalassobacillus pellis]